jgi:hypothetical protein
MIEETPNILPSNKILRYSQNLFGEELKTPQINVYHDESGTFGSSRWCLTGLLWVSADMQDKIVTQLTRSREKHGYWGEIHYSELPSNFDGKHNADARVARDWLDEYICHLCTQSWFYILAVDTRHRLYDHKKFEHQFHAYNRFTSIAMYGALKWQFPDISEMELTIFSDNKCRRPGGILGDGVNSDNFESYISTRLQETIHKDKRAPRVTFDTPVQIITIPKNRNKSQIKAEEELIQLCDIILGSVFSAITLSSKVQTKTWLGKRITPLIEDVGKKPWEQRCGLHRIFSVSFFPGSTGLMYSTWKPTTASESNQGRLL